MVDHAIYSPRKQGRKLYTLAPNLPIRKRDSQSFLVLKEANKGWGLELLGFVSRNGSENRSELIS